MSKVINVFTDGSCYPNPGPGGWAYIIEEDGKSREAYGSEPKSTNQRMEIMAVIQALSSLGDRRRLVRVHSDSAYVVNCFQQRWHVKWVARGWKNAYGKPVANQDLWERLLDLCGWLKVEFVKVKGHAGHPQNERCDELAGLARLECSV